MTAAESIPPKGEALASLCEDLIQAWRQVASSRASDPASAPVSRDATQARTELQLDEGPAKAEYAAGTIATALTDAIAQLLQAVATLVRRQPVVQLAIWPLVRAELETAGRVAWLLGPIHEQDAASRRVARAMLEQLASLQRAKYTAAHSGSLLKEAKRHRDGLHEQIKAMYPGQVNTTFGLPTDIDTWEIGSEQFVPLGQGIKMFTDRAFTKSKSLYDFLSDYSHPSIISIARQTEREEVDGISYTTYPVDEELLERQTQMGCFILYKAAHLVAEYHELDTTPLEEWADSTPTWFGSS